MNYYQFKDRQCIFKKGAESDLFFFILGGGVGLHLAGSINSHCIKVMTRGFSLGEKGILENEVRSLSAYSVGTAQLIGVEAHDFRRLIALPVKMEKDRRLKFIKKYIGGITKLSDVTQDKIAYVIKEEKF